MSFAEESFDPACPISSRVGQGQGRGQSATESEPSTFTTKRGPLSPTSPSDLLLSSWRDRRHPAFRDLVVETPRYDEQHAVCRVGDEHGHLLPPTFSIAAEGDPDASGLIDGICSPGAAADVSPLAILPLMDFGGAADTLPSPSTTVFLNQLLDDVTVATAASSSSSLHLDDAPPDSLKAQPPPPVQKSTTAPPTKSSTGASDAVSASSAHVPDFVYDPQRTWSTFYVDRSFLTSPDDDVEIRAKTRRDTPCLSVPERLYSSLKYEIKQRAVGPFVTKVPFLLSRICVVDAEKGHEVRRNNRPAVKGTIEAALVKPTDKKKKKQQHLPPSPGAAMPVLEGGLRPQFQDISFHSDHTLYCWHISYFAPSDLEHPILIKRSPSFKVFARKPGKVSSRKRKRSADTPQAPNNNNNNNSDDDDDADNSGTTDTGAGAGGSAPTEQPGDAATTSPRKMAKCSPAPQEAPAPASCSSSSAACSNVVFDEFLRKLDELVKCKERLTEQERHVCLDLVVAKLLAADPSYFAALADPPPSADSFPQQHLQPDLSFVLSSPSRHSPN